MKHMHSHPGHEFDFSSAKLLWKSKNVLESKIIESSCIQTFPSCNTQPGKVTVNPILASVITRMSNIWKFVRGPAPFSTHQALYTQPLPLPPHLSFPPLQYSYLFHPHSHLTHHPSLNPLPQQQLQSSLLIGTLILD